LCVSTRSGKKFEVKYWNRKNEGKHSCHKTPTAFQAKQTLNLLGGEVGKYAQFFQTGARFISNFEFFSLKCFASHQIFPFTIHLQAFCEIALEITRVSLCKDSNTMSFPFLSRSSEFSSLSSESFPESDSSPQIQGLNFFLREDSLRPLGCNTSGMWLWESKTPEEI